MKNPLILSLLLLLGSALGAYAADAESIWTESCRKCHGISGDGDTKMGKKLKLGDYTKAEIQAEFTDEEAFRVIKEGVTDENGKVRMKPAKDLTDEDITALVQYVRSLQK